MIESLTVGKRRLFTGFLLILLVVIAEAVSMVGISLAPRLIDEEIWRVERILAAQTASIEEFLTPGRKEVLDSVLGWTYARGTSFIGVTEQGIRSPRSYASEKPDSILRVAAFGDSFIFGNEVTDDQVWSLRLEQFHPSIELLNYGVGGYGTDQAHVRYLLEGSDLSPEIVLIGFAPVNLRRIQNVYRRFISHREMPLSKPRYVLENDQLTLLPPPLPDRASLEDLLADPQSMRALGEHDRWYRSSIYGNVLYDRSATVRLATFLGGKIYHRYLSPDRLLKGPTFNPSSSALTLQLAVLKQFVVDVEANGQMPIVVLLPDQESVARISIGQETIYSPLTRALDSEGIRWLDVGGALAPEAALDALFAPGGHYSALGNELVGEWLGDALLSLKADSGT